MRMKGRSGVHRGGFNRVRQREGLKSNARSGDKLQRSGKP